MTSAAAIATAIATTLYAFKLRRDLKKALTYCLHVMNKNKTLYTIAAAHGCAPLELAAENSLYKCKDCNTTWQAKAPEVQWLDDTLNNRTVQRWDAV